MSEVQIFHATLDGARELEVTPFRIEKELQGLFERHLRDLTGIDFVATEHRTGSRHKRRADTLGLDSKQRPVVIEYKLGHGGAAISQGLDYLFWLEDHKGDFRELVREELGTERSRNIDFRNARLLCVAGEFRREDAYHAETNTRSIELLCVRRHGASTILLEWVLREEEASKRDPVPPSPNGGHDFSVHAPWVKADEELRQLFMALHDFVLSHGTDVQVTAIKSYIKFERKSGVASVKIQTWNERLVAYTWLDPGTVPLEEGFTQDITEVNSEPGKLLIFIRNQADLDRAKPLIKRSYDEAG